MHGAHTVANDILSRLWHAFFQPQNFYKQSKLSNGLNANTQWVINIIYTSNVEINIFTVQPPPNEYFYFKFKKCSN